MEKYFIKIIRWPIGCLIFFLLGCHQAEQYKKLIVTKEDSVSRVAMIKKAFIDISLAGKYVQSGDLITRTGNDFTSESLRSLNRRNTTYSHCGIAIIEHDSIFVYHALGGDWNPDQKIRKDLLADFANPYSNKGMGIFTFNFPDSTQKKLIDSVHSLYDQGIRFDMDFDLKTDERMYCAEFVYKCLLKGCNGKMEFNHSHIKQFEFIGVDDIFLHPRCVSKQQIVYK